MRLIDADEILKSEHQHYDYMADEYYVLVRDIENAPTVDAEAKEIGYAECSNALLKMWMDKVVTDNEYYRIAERLNRYWGERREDEE